MYRLQHSKSVQYFNSLNYNLLAIYFNDPLFSYKSQQLHYQIIDKKYHTYRLCSSGTQAAVFFPRP